MVEKTTNSSALLIKSISSAVQRTSQSSSQDQNAASLLISMKFVSIMFVAFATASRSAAFSASSAFTRGTKVSVQKYSTTKLSMKLQTAIVGLPNVGKSTLFNALTETQGAEAANYPFCTIEPNVGIVEVPDPKLQVLEEINSSAKVSDHHHKSRVLRCLLLEYLFMFTKMLRLFQRPWNSLMWLD